MLFDLLIQFMDVYFLIFGLKLCVLVLLVSLFAVKRAMSRNNCHKTLFRHLTGRPALVLVCFGLSTCIIMYINISYAFVSSNTAEVRIRLCLISACTIKINYIKLFH